MCGRDPLGNSDPVGCDDSAGFDDPTCCRSLMVAAMPWVVANPWSVTISATHCVVDIPWAAATPWQAPWVGASRWAPATFPKCGTYHCLPRGPIAYSDGLCDLSFLRCMRAGSYNWSLICFPAACRHDAIASTYGDAPVRDASVMFVSVGPASPKKWRPVLQPPCSADPATENAPQGLHFWTQRNESSLNLWEALDLPDEDVNVSAIVRHAQRHGGLGSTLCICVCGCLTERGVEYHQDCVVAPRQR